MSSDSHCPPAKFGTLLGVGAGGVPAYSSDYATADRAQLPNREAYRSYVDGHFMGYKWQCVELARRWLYLTKGCVFDDISMAYDIFRLRSLRVIADGTLLPLKSFRNGARRPPAVGSLLIWNEGGEFEVTGHVAVVTGVLADRVRIIEQNHDNRVWPAGQDYARELMATTTEDGGYWVSCPTGEAAILGWVTQTDDGSGAEEIIDPDRRLFNLQPRELPPAAAPAKPWLDPRQPDEAAYIAMMGGCTLTADPADQRKYFCVSETAYKELKRATNELHAMFLRATDFVLEDDALLARFCIPPVLWPRIRASWQHRRHQMITGRFDFAVCAEGIKAYEYNADSASCHMECGKVQGKWARAFGCDVGRCTGGHLHDDLVEAWEDAGVEGVLHIMQDHDLEETYHALYMRSAIEKAGIRCKTITGLGGLGWDAEGRVVDADGEPILRVWKTWAWETAIDQIRAECAEDDENARLHRAVDRCALPPRLSDVLLRPEVMVHEPLWTVIPSNKAILPVMWMLFPNHPYLLNTQYEVTDEFRRKGYVAKPIVGRCGSNIRIYAANDGLIAGTSGQFDDRDQIYQELFPLPRIGGDNVQISTFSVAGSYGGACVRVDPSPIITTHSDVLALRVVADAEMLRRGSPRAKARKRRAVPT